MGRNKMKKKNLSNPKLTKGSYVPSGLTREQYDSIRSGEMKKKAGNYRKNEAKAGKFTDFTDWYLDRGTSEAGSWLNDKTLGHTYAKTKYDWSGKEDFRTVDAGRGLKTKKNSKSNRR